MATIKTQMTNSLIVPPFWTHEYGFSRRYAISILILGEKLVDDVKMSWYQYVNKEVIWKARNSSQTTFRLSESDHQNLKILAAKEKKTIQELILLALDKVSPIGENNENSRCLVSTTRQRPNLKLPA